MPRDEDALRVLARASGLATTAEGLVEAWQRTKLEVRTPARAAVLPAAAVGGGGAARRRLRAHQRAGRGAARGDRLRATRAGALHHIAALTGGVSRRAQIQRTLLPVMLQWFAEGADPDYGLLAFRRLSDDLGEAYWFLRMLRDSSGAARRLTHVLSSSRFVGILFERIPEAAAWLENDAELRPRALDELLEETAATVARHADDPDAAAGALKTARRREVLRLALAAILGMITVEELGQGLSAITDRDRSPAPSRSRTATATASSSASSRWAATGERSSASAATPTSCTSTGRPESSPRRRSGAPSASCTS